MKAYFAVMDHKWQMSKAVGYEVPLEEAVVDWAVQEAEIGTMGPFDPALLAKWWHELEPASQVLEPPLIKTAELEPLLSTAERPLVHLTSSELEEKLPEILQEEIPDL
jgi:hypothetical protein